jgi:ubiquinone/menaquinone biosynthesis C-methylase UbiE
MSIFNMLSRRTVISYLSSHDILIEIEGEEQNTMPMEPPREHESTYFVQDRSNLDEMTRLEIQDNMITTGMGGVLPELIDPTILRSILDVGCGTGGWLMETARTYPTIKKLVGGDISGKTLDYARTKAEQQQLDTRVQFKTMDALRALDFPDASFDLVNQRFGTSWLRTWEWTKILLEYQRVTRPSGIIRITETSGFESSSPAQMRLASITLEAGHHAGFYFTANCDGLTRELVRLMRQHKVENIQTHNYVLVYRAGTSEHQLFYEDMKRFYRVAWPFLQKWTRVPSDYEEIYQQALKEMQQPDFVATMTLLTAWGTTPTNGEHLLIRGLK